ncbi:coiled-coil domain-containing protein 169-like [Neopelma chrysocephalum]|uniref:coiled-coil domain-containing protein 169-like n=1 Tax=Neopelma chrysocephalum TaxID=114329 RepID=UPI000FCD3A04|nr:coiled-coil domain-containing protein 169-like [Neopelma chrysocephalum]
MSRADTEADGRRWHEEPDRATCRGFRWSEGREGPHTRGRPGSGGRAPLHTRANGTRQRTPGPEQINMTPAAGRARPRLPLSSGRATWAAEEGVPEPGVGTATLPPASGPTAPLPQAPPGARSRRPAQRRPTRRLRAGRAPAAAMGEGGERRAAKPDRLELGRERRKKQMLEISIFKLRNTVTELEKRLNSIEDEGNEWKTRYETQVELNKQLERQIKILQDKVELIRGNPADKLSIVRTFDHMPVGSLKEVLKQLEEEKSRLQNQLKDYELRLKQEAKAYHKANDERRMYLSEILQTSAPLKIVERQKPDALTGKGEKQILRGRYSVPGNPKMVSPRKRSIKKTVGVNKLPQLKH